MPQRAAGWLVPFDTGVSLECVLEDEDVRALVLVISALWLILIAHYGMELVIRTLRLRSEVFWR